MPGYKWVKPDLRSACRTSALTRRPRCTSARRCSLILLPSLPRSALMTWLCTGIAQAAGVCRQALGTIRRPAVFKMLLVQQARSGNDTRLGAVLVNEIGDVPKQGLYRHPDPWLESGVQCRVL